MLLLAVTSSVSLNDIRAVSGGRENLHRTFRLCRCVERNFGEQIKIEDDVCVQVSASYSDCKTVTSWSSRQPEKVTFSVD